VITSLHIINKLVFVMETLFAFSAIGTEFLNTV
jgi:hypothetical protein